MPKQIPVDYDNQFDPDCPTEPGSVITNIMTFLGEPKIQFVITLDGEKIETDNLLTSLSIYSVNINEQIEARLAQLGWEIKRTRPWNNESATNK